MLSKILLKGKTCYQRLNLKKMGLIFIKLSKIDVKDNGAYNYHAIRLCSKKMGYIAIMLSMNLAKKQKQSMYLSRYQRLRKRGIYLLRSPRIQLENTGHVAVMADSSESTLDR